MGQNLKNRLRRIRSVSGTKQDIPEGKAGQPGKISGESGIDALWPGWKEAGYKTLKRVVPCDLPFELPSAFPAELPLLLYDIYRFGRIPRLDDLVFFDLETTGLSGGAGTVAFLAAFGRFSRAGFEITQYLLLDYPGENDFVKQAAAELCASPLVVSYNGKSFDSQIMKTRCLMKGIKIPDYCHADLLHPARRLWKKALPDCSQATVEVSVLGLDREGDVSGALAPDIWFSFLRSGKNDELLSICGHNLRDIKGLASLFLCFGQIAASPFESLKKFNVDEEALALLWQRGVKRNQFFFNDEASRDCSKTGELLLKRAADKGSLRAALAMAIKAEWRLNDPALALSYVKIALSNPEIPERLREELERRQQRLLAKILHYSRLTGSTSTSR